MLNILKSSDNNSSALEQKYIKNDIDTLTQYFKKSKSLESKKEARKKLLLYKLKELALKTKNEDIKRVQEILESQSEYQIYEVAKKILIYLNKIRVFKSVDSLIDVRIYKALLYELLDIDIGASTEYKEIIKLKNSKELFKLYHEFIERSMIINNSKK